MYWKSNKLKAILFGSTTRFDFILSELKKTLFIYLAIFAGGLSELINLFSALYFWNKFGQPDYYFRPNVDPIFSHIFVIIFAMFVGLLFGVIVHFFAKNTKRRISYRPIFYLMLVNATIICSIFNYYTIKNQIYPVIVFTPFFIVSFINILIALIFTKKPKT